MSAEAQTIPEEQIRSAFQRWKNLEEEKARIADDLKELFAEQKAFGHDTKAMRAAFRLKVKMDQARPEDAEHEALVDTYLAALNAPSIPARDTRMRARENIEEFDPITGEFITKSPRKAAEAVSERTAFTSATIAPVLVEADKAEAVAGVLGQPEAIPALTVQHDGVNVGGPERAGVTAGETATQFHAKASDDACEAGRKALGRAEASADAPDGAELVSRGVGDRAPTATSEEMDATAGETAPNSSVLWNEWQAAEIDPSEDREEGQSPDDGLSVVGANIGGDHVNAPNSTAATAGALVNHAPAIKHRFRPNCQHREHCRSGTVNHCHSCKQAMREGNAA